MVKRRVLLVAGGVWQVPLARTIRGMGFDLACANLYPDSPAFAYSEMTHVCDVREKKPICDFARKVDPCAVVTDQSDISVPTVAYVAEELGLPGIGQPVSRLFTNKWMMREFCRGNGFPAPEYSLCQGPKDAIEFMRRHSGACVLKPIDNQGSRGVVLVHDSDGVCRVWDCAAKQSRDGRLMIEQYMEGMEFTVEGIKVGKVHHTLGISCKRRMKENPMVAQELLYEDSHGEVDYGELRDQHNRLVERMGLLFGLTHAEYIYNGGKFRLVEIAARGGGNNISSHIVPVVSGVQSNACLVRMAMGESLDIGQIARSAVQAPCVLLAFISFDKGIVRSVDGVEDVRAMAGVLDVGLNIRAGAPVPDIVDDTSRHGYVIVAGQDSKEVRTVALNAKKAIRVTYA